MNNQLMAVGIDSVKTARFELWRTFKDAQLAKIFSLEEITYARSNKFFFAQRLAVRFAAKEAFLKALQQIYPEKKLRLLQIAQAVTIKKNEYGMPSLKINWQKIGIDQIFFTSVSLTHQTCHATAIVILYNQNLSAIRKKLLKNINQ